MPDYQNLPAPKKVARRPEVFQQPTEERIVQVIEEEIDNLLSRFEVEHAATRIFEEIIAPLHRQWADQLRVEGDKR